MDILVIGTLEQFKLIIREIIVKDIYSKHEECRVGI